MPTCSSRDFSTTSVSCQRRPQFPLLLGFSAKPPPPSKTPAKVLIPQLMSCRILRSVQVWICSRHAIFLSSLVACVGRLSSCQRVGTASRVVTAGQPTIALFWLHCCLVLL